MTLTVDVLTLVDILEVPTYSGYAPTGAQLPYVVARPLTVDFTEVAVNGAALGWDNQATLYCCGGSVDAAHNLAVAVLNTLHGAYVGGTTLACSIGYNGAVVEGHYESQVTVQRNEGAIT